MHSTKIKNSSLQKKKLGTKKIILLIILFFIFLIVLIVLTNNKKKLVVKDALKLYQQKKSEGVNFSSQCLGYVDGYAVDIVHVPRTQEDNLIKNQCKKYREGIVKHFIELDKYGNIVRKV